MAGIWKVNEEIKGFIKDWIYTNERKVFLEILIWNVCVINIARVKLIKII